MTKDISIKNIGFNLSTCEAILISTHNLCFDREINLQNHLLMVTKYPLNIMQTCPCNEDPLTPHFYIVKLGFTGVYFFLNFAPKHRLWVLVRTTSLRRF